MREALARTDHDFIFSEPAPKPRKAARGGVIAAAAKSVRVAHRAAKYTSLIAGALLAAVVTGILINALALQKSRHPAPFFAKHVALPVTPPETVPFPAPRPSAATPVQAPEKVVASHPQPTLETPAVPHPTLVRDPIAQLLKAPPPPPKPAPTPTEPSRTVAAAQHALVKLGFVLKADGLIGTTTRQAVERFERDRHLPVRGDLTPKVLRELSAQSGVAIE